MPMGCSMFNDKLVKFLNSAYCYRKMLKNVIWLMQVDNFEVKTALDIRASLE